MAPADDELLPENTSGYKLSQPKQSLADYQKMGKFRGGNGGLIDVFAIPVMDSIIVKSP
jgi:hypothetical protein